MHEANKNCPLCRGLGQYYADDGINNGMVGCGCRANPKAKQRVTDLERRVANLEAMRERDISATHRDLRERIAKLEAPLKHELSADDVRFLQTLAQRLEDHGRDKYHPSAATWLSFGRSLSYILEKIAMEITS